MELHVAILGALGVLLIGTMSPGPSFVLVARISIGESRSHGLAAAFGMGVGSAAFCGLVLLGLHALLTTVEWLHLALRVAGGLYLLFIAWQMWKGATKPVPVSAGADPGSVRGRSLAKSFGLALGTQVSNPKTALFYGSIFAALLPVGLPLWVSLALPMLVLLMETAWYGLVALLFSATGPRSVYLRAKTLLDRTAAGIVGLLGLRLLLDAARAR
ncbi:LysE family translocator [Arenibaculum sp.]|uniref:LysE family translocator n=1 Tax=Arenibaculum sp. TaxID=2865862 RepID=UPI002E157F3B|nr:LysE family translocator [Arenibaculum sp.]